MKKNGACDAGVTLRYVYEYHNYTGDRFAERVEHLHLYFYDEGGRLVLRTDTAAADLSGGNKLTVQLPTGFYTAVTWGNIHTDNFAASDVEAIDEMIVGLECLNKGVLTTDEPGNLFYGIHRFQLTSRGYEATVPLMKNPSIVQVRVGGLSADKADDLRVITEVRGKNGHYRYDNTYPTDAPAITYISRQSFDEGYVCERLQVYRLFPDDAETILSVTAIDPVSGDTVYSLEKPLVPILTDKAKGDRQEYLDRADLHLIYVNLSEGSASTVKSWDEIDHKQEIRP